MKIFKFGGASINSKERIANTGSIISSLEGEKLLIVVSAMGKTTNALEAVAHSFFQSKKEETLQHFEKIKDAHISTIERLLNESNSTKAKENLKPFFTETEWLLHDSPVRGFDYYYDQIVCSGELMSSSILCSYLQELNLNASWIDVRDLLRTDDNFRDAGIDWEYSKNKITEVINSLFEQTDIIVTQGFIGSTDQNESTTLGREGSDYTAAVFAHVLNADSVTIWKDVEAVMSADPKKYPEAAVIKELSYQEVIEMAYYGAQVIHPKTIKPLQNKNIPLLVKSFIDSSLPGTIISAKVNKNLPPIIVHKENQVLMTFQSRDFTFIEEKPAEQLQQLFSKIKIKPNLTQHTAISFLCCFDFHPEKIEALAIEASNIFDVQLEKELSLLTIRHYNSNTIPESIKNKTILLEQRTTETIQFLTRM
jgi:aspartate kinase